jgi:choline dehydrogenase-like flavoprotein
VNIVPPMRGRVAVVGAGPAGTATALSVHQAGHDVTLLERCPQARPAGNILNLWPPPVRALGLLVAPESNDWTAKLPAWTELRPGDASTTLRQHPDRVPFACWPPRPNGYISDVFRIYRGATIALMTDGRFLGEGDHPDPLYDVLESEWTLDQCVELPHWPYRQDSLMIWRR